MGLGVGLGLGLGLELGLGSGVAPGQGRAWQRRLELECCEIGLGACVGYRSRCMAWMAHGAGGTSDRMVCAWRGGRQRACAARQPPFRPLRPLPPYLPPPGLSPLCE